MVRAEENDLGVTDSATLLALVYRLLYQGSVWWIVRTLCLWNGLLEGAAHGAVRLLGIMMLDLNKLAAVANCICNDSRTPASPTCCISPPDRRS